MNKKTFALLSITFGFFFSFFLAAIFQHPLYISKWVLLLAGLGGFGSALLFYLVNGKVTQTVKLNVSKFKQLALISFSLSLAWLVLFGYTPNTLLMPAVKVALTIPPTASSSAPLTSLVAISESSGNHFFSLKQPEVSYSANVEYQDRKLIIHADPTQPASISLQGKAWSERINFSFESSTRDFVVDFFVDGIKSTYGYTAGQGDAAFITSVAVPPAYISHILSFVSFFLSLLVSFFFLRLQFELLKEEKQPFLSTLILILQCLFILALVVYKFYQFSPTFLLPNIDSFLFNTYGREILRGKILYRDLWDHKGPLIFVFNTLGQSLNLVLLKLFSKKLGLFWPALLFIFLWAITRRFEGGNLTEDYAVLLYMLAFYLYWLYLQHKRKPLLPFLIGLCAGASFMLRANFISPFIAIGICLLYEGFSEKKMRAAFVSIAWMALGFLSVAAVFVVYFAAHGILFEFLDAAFFFNFLYSQQSKLNLTHKLSFVIKLFPIYMCIITGCLAFVLSAWSRKDVFNTNENNFLRMVCIGYGIELLLYNISGKNFFHYMVPLAPYEALILAFFGILLLKSIQDKPWLNTANMLFTPLMLLMLFLGFSGKLYDLRFKIPLSQSDIYQQLQSKLNPSDQLVMWGHSADFQYAVDVPSPSRYYYQFPFTNCGYVTDAMIAEFIRDIDTAKPVIVDTRIMGSAYLLDANIREKNGACPPLERFFEYFRQNYRLTVTLTNRMEVYRSIR